MGWKQETMAAGPLVAVLGSLNVDRTFRTPRIPAPGETLVAAEAFSSFGGKGANQALAARRAGAQVRMIGCVGDDDEGASYRDHLQSEGIDTTGILVAPGMTTGCAFITVDEAGENAIVVHPGANHALTPRMIDDGMLHQVDIILVQLECPLETVVHAAQMARAAGAEVVLNPSPWNDAVRKSGIEAHVCIVNETEAEALLGGVRADEGDPAEVLTLAGCHVLVVTRGARSTVVVSQDEGRCEVVPPEVTPVDTVGAGDAFAGAFTVARARGSGLVEAVEFANAAAGLSTLKFGAQAAIPSREQIEAVLSAGPQ